MKKKNTIDVKNNNKKKSNKDIKIKNPPKKNVKFKIDKNDKKGNQQHIELINHTHNDKNNANQNKNIHNNRSHSQKNIKKVNNNKSGNDKTDNNKNNKNKDKININNKNDNFISNKFFKNKRNNQIPVNKSLTSNNKTSQFQSTYRNIINSKNNKPKNISIYNFNFGDKVEQDEHHNELSNYELNDLEYEESIKLDERKFPEIYWSILKREHLILFTFFSCNDYNLLPIKCARFVFLVCTDMALNVFFFSDESMNTIFLTYGKYDFFQKIPQMVYTVIVSQLLEVLLCFLSLTDKYVYQIKKLKNKNITNLNRIFRIIKIKLCFFFIITFILFLFYWYIISAFCAVYINTQMIFIKDSIFSFLLGLIYPFILYLFPSCLRIICLNYRHTNLKCLYKLSDIIPIF